MGPARLRWSLGVSAMSLRAYKTSWLLWLVLWFGSVLGFWLVLPPVREAFTLFFAGQLRFRSPQLNLLEGMAIFSVVTGWLLQCLVVILFSWCHERSKKR